MEYAHYNPHHFSHNHPLHHTNSPPKASSNDTVCHGCDLDLLPGNDYYACKSCQFSLHQVCYNMPKKTRHPSHPNHYLTLSALSSPVSSAINDNNCRACGLIIMNGFYYSCDKCKIFYHTLCATIPLSVSIASHPHSLKLEFSPPYDFSCDLCAKPSYDNGWLYRCQICEFDAHIGCAILHQRIQPFSQLFIPLPGTLTRQIIYKEADFVNEARELMQLVIMGISRNIGGESVTIDGGWDQRFRSPRNRSKFDHSTVGSEDFTISSYQFSDLCFSIDLAKSYQNHDLKTEVGKPSIDDLSEAVKEIDQHEEKKFIVIGRQESLLNQAFLAGGGAFYQNQLSYYGSRGCETKETSKKSNKARSWCYYIWMILCCNCLDTKEDDDDDFPRTTVYDNHSQWIRV